MAMVPVIECRMPTVASVSVTARPVVLTADVGTSARLTRGNSDSAGTAAIPISSFRRSGDERPRSLSSDTCDPLGFGQQLVLARGDWRDLCTAEIRKIAYIAPQND